MGEDDCDTGPASRESSPRLESPAPGVTPSTAMTRKFTFILNFIIIKLLTRIILHSIANKSSYKIVFLRANM